MFLIFLIVYKISNKIQNSSISPFSYSSGNPNSTTYFPFCCDGQKVNGRKFRRISTISFFSFSSNTSIGKKTKSMCRETRRSVGNSMTRFCRSRNMRPRAWEKAERQYRSPAERITFLVLFRITVI